ncbi:hypothetical protein Sjap_022917 [Stephania japonica]|uniref:Uncharacterized protein n=1 Tax=Stephania japonica TaxID=461633 RepID=A0AAP0EPR4_9MAGN
MVVLFMGSLPSLREVVKEDVVLSSANCNTYSPLCNSLYPIMGVRNINTTNMTNKNKNNKKQK